MGCNPLSVNNDLTGTHFMRIEINYHIVPGQPEKIF